MLENASIHLLPLLSLFLVYSLSSLLLLSRSRFLSLSLLVVGCFLFNSIFLCLALNRLAFLPFTAKFRKFNINLFFGVINQPPSGSNRNLNASEFYTEIYSVLYATATTGTQPTTATRELPALSLSHNTKTKTTTIFTIHLKYYIKLTTESKTNSN